MKPIIVHFYLKSCFLDRFYSIPKVWLNSVPNVHPNVSSICPSLGLNSDCSDHGFWRWKFKKSEAFP